MIRELNQGMAEDKVGSGTECKLCAVGEQHSGLPVWDRALLSTENFVVIPSLGSMVEGWLLLVPKAHTLSAAVLPHSLYCELQDLKSEVEVILKGKYGCVSFFEHGPSKANASTGCGVDHAHVHAVPCTMAVKEGAVQYLPTGVAFQPGSIENCRSAVHAGLDYLYFESDCKEFIATAPRFSSQTFRRALADMHSASDKFDWKSYPCLQVVAATVRALAPTIRTSLIN